MSFNTPQKQTQQDELTPLRNDTQNSLFPDVSEEGMDEVHMFSSTFQSAARTQAASPSSGLMLTHETTPYDDGKAIIDPLLSSPSLDESERKMIKKSLEVLDEQHRSNSNKLTWKRKRRMALNIVMAMIIISLFVLFVVGVLFAIGEVMNGPPWQPVGKYQILELQTGESFLNNYEFYIGKDSTGSKSGGQHYNTYVSRSKAMKLGILNVSTDSMFHDNEDDGTISQKITSENDNDRRLEEETFIYMSSAPSDEGPRQSIRLEGKKRFNRGLFIVDLKHIPTGCGSWPKLWLTDEQNWPINGEIDIVEGVNRQDAAQTTLRTARKCTMQNDDNSNGDGDDPDSPVRTGEWLVDGTNQESATNCNVFENDDSKFRWSRGCVTVDPDGETFGTPFNAQGGGIYALEWDPINQHIRSWIFTSHNHRIPKNLQDSIDHGSGKTDNPTIAPNPDEWGVPFGYFPIGDGTDCASTHFRNLRLVINLAFCGGMAADRFSVDCPEQHEHYKTCSEWIKSRSDSLEEAYWKIRGVYIYQREWVRAWTSR